MGMYTELVISTMIKDDPEVVGALKTMLGEQEDIKDLPKHPLFSTPRWRIMLICSSHYFVPISVHAFRYNEIAKAWALVTRSDFKNYDNEINLFIDWIKPYLDCSYGEMVGYFRYEEDEIPTIVYNT